MDQLAQLIAEKGNLIGVGTLIALKLCEYLWAWIKAKEKLTQQSIIDLKEELSKSNNTLVATQIEIKKLRVDMRKAFIVIKELAGDSWPRMADKMKDLSEFNS